MFTLFYFISIHFSAFYYDHELTILIRDYDTRKYNHRGKSQENIRYNIGNL